MLLLILHRCHTPTSINHKITKAFIQQGKGESEAQSRHAEGCHQEDSSECQQARRIPLPSKTIGSGGGE